MKRFLSANTVAIFFLAIFPWLVFWQAALGIFTFAAGDLSSFFYPVRLQLARALAEGRLPLWEPGMGAGFPLFAEGQVAALYPPNLVLFRLLPTPLALSWSILFHLSWAAVGVYAFARASGLRVSSAMLAGFVFSFSGFFLAHIQHVSLIATAAWLGWILFLQRQMLTARHDRLRTWRVWFALASVAVGMQFLSGFPQIALLNLIPFGLVSIVAPMTWQRGEGFSARRIIESVGLSGGCVAFGVGCATVQWLPTIELLNLSVRAREGNLQFFTSYSLDPRALYQFIAPFAFLGKPEIANQEYWAYFGIAPLALALVALIRRDSRTWFFAALALIALSLALGESNPLYSFLYFIPVFNRFRIPARFLLLFVFAMSFLAANGLEELQRRFGRSTRTAQLVWAVIIFWVVIDLGVFSQSFLVTLDRMVSQAEFTQTPRPVLSMNSVSPLDRVYATPYTGSLAPNRLMAFGKTTVQIYSPLAMARTDEYLSEMSPRMLDLLNVRYYVRASDPPFYDPESRFLPFEFNPFEANIEIPQMRVTSIQTVSYTGETRDMSDGFLAGEIRLTLKNGAAITLPLRSGIETADWAYDGYRDNGGIKHSRPADTTTFRAYHRTVGREFAGHEYLARYYLDSAEVVAQVSAHSFLPNNQLAIDNILLTDDLGRTVSLATLAHKNNSALAFKSDTITLFENRDALPRAFLTHQSQIVSDNQILAHMRDPGFDPSRVVFLSEGESLDDARGLDPTESVEMIEYAPERVQLRVATNRAGYLLLADSWYPGWVATVDGRDAAIQRADYIFRAVKLDPGEHTVVFEYRPTSFIIGAAISVISFVALASFTCYLWLRK